MQAEELAFTQQSTHPNFTGRRFTAVLNRGRPNVDNAITDPNDPELIRQFESMFAWEHPWVVKFRKVEADSPYRKNFAQAKTVAQLLTEMGADSGKRSYEEGVHQAQLAEELQVRPKPPSHLPTRASSHCLSLRQRSLWHERQV